MVLIPFSLTLSDALQFYKQHSDQHCPAEDPVAVCLSSSPRCCPSEGSVPRTALLIWLNKFVCRRKCPMWDLPALAQNTRSNV